HGGRRAGELPHDPARAESLWPRPRRKARSAGAQQDRRARRRRNQGEAGKTKTQRQEAGASPFRRERPGPRRSAGRALCRDQGSARGRAAARGAGGMSERAGYRIAAAKRIVLKIGSALLVDDKTGRIRRDWLDALADDVAACRKAGQDVVIVTSGAIAAGRRLLGLEGNALRLEEKQAAAAAGQVRLAHAYQESLARHDITAAQVLVTLSDTEERRRHLNARATLLTLLEIGAVPVINENDTVATEEIRFGDNDRLGARVAQMVSADTLVLFSDIDGLYTANPKTDAAAKHLAEIREITPEIMAMAGAPISADSRGGMITKLEAAKIAFGAGCRMA